jgi:glycosyltransferase involved in cell wall biosynthesis
MSTSPAVLVLTLYPLSGAYRERLERLVGTTVETRLVSDLQRGGVKGFLRHLLRSRWRRVILPCETADGASVLSVLILLAVSHKVPRVEVCDPDGGLRTVRPREYLSAAWGLALSSLHGVWARFRSVRGARASLRRKAPHLRISEGPQRVLYLKNNLWFGLRAGGSVGHVAGVINGLVELGHEVQFVSPEVPRYLSPRVRAERVTAFRHFAIPPRANLCRLQRYSVETAMAAAREFRPTFLYQRLSMGDWTGAELADRLGIPLVVEYNGSELWIARHWGGDTGSDPVMEAAEGAILKRADLIFTISLPLRDELVDRGFEPGRVAWYPNCVDASVYDPAAIPGLARSEARARLGAGPDDFVILFMGTFGLWHGAEVFARAAAELAGDGGWIRGGRVRFAFVGDGRTRPLCEEIIQSSPAAGVTVFAGLVAQHEAPAYLAAADAFVSPHVPNADGSRFFGSPTKLFEYMAMAKPIVASALDQIADVLEDGRTAALTKPGDADSLAAGIRRVVGDRDLGRRLGEAARAEVLAKYTWTRHVEVMLEALRHNAGGTGVAGA